MNKNVVIDCSVSLSVASILLGVSMSTVQRWLKSGELGSLDLLDIRRKLVKDLRSHIEKELGVTVSSAQKPAWQAEAVEVKDDVLSSRSALDILDQL